MPPLTADAPSLLTLIRPIRARPPLNLPSPPHPPLLSAHTPSPHTHPTHTHTDRIVNTIGSFSTALGNACKCDPWAVEIFAEEVVRGGPAFAISLVVSGVEPRLRQLAELGAWQVGACV